MILKSNLPTVSVLLPIRNEENFIRDALLSIFNQSYSKDLIEVIVVDGMSNDLTRKIIEDLLMEYPDRKLKILDNVRRIVPTGLNLAIREAIGEIIVRVDGHCEIAQEYIENCVDILLNQNVDGVGGPIDTIGETILSESIAYAMSSKFGVGGSFFRTIKDKELIVDSIAFPAYKREIIEKVGLFDEELVRNQDDEYNYRIRKTGGKILLSPNIKSKYYSRASLGKLFKQYYQYGFWKIRVLQKHPLQMRPRQFVPFLFVLSVLVSLIFTSISVYGKILLVDILGSYLIANLVASLLVSKKEGWKYLPLLPIVFSILHISYGLGFMVGLIRFIHRWGDKEGKVPQFDFNSPA